ncbi:hypothetical protein EDD11_000387 [Mortierella claussenii]|nr:hypothetical protein EDD11_000387 [Mortierella claussenii]
MASLGSSVSQLSLLDDHTSMTSSIHVSLSSSPSTISPASSLVDARQLDSGVDLQEAPRPVNRRSNRNFRIIPAAEIEVMNETSLQDSIRRSQKLQNNLGHDSSSASSSGRRGHDTQPQDNGSDKQSPQLVLLHDPEDGYEDEEESYFGDILDKYCNSDEDPTSPMTASPTSPFSTAPGWKAFQSAQPPTPPVSRSFNLHSTAAGRRERGAVSKAAAVLQDHHSSAEVTSHSRQDRSLIGICLSASSLLVNFHSFSLSATEFKE